MKKLIFDKKKSNYSSKSVRHLTSSKIENYAICLQYLRETIFHSSIKWRSHIDSHSILLEIVDISAKQ